MPKLSFPSVLLLLLNAAPLTRGDENGERMVFCHYVPWMNVQNQEHVARRDFPLLMGFALELPFRELLELPCFLRQPVNRIPDDLRGVPV